MTTWKATALSVNPPSRQVADTDRMAITFQAGEDIADATATLAIMPGNTITEGLIESVTAGEDSATVLVSGLTRGTTYELCVIFERADATAWTRTLALVCVA